MADVDIKVRVISSGAEKAVTGLGRAAKKTENEFKGLNVSIKNSTSAFKVFLGNVAAKALTTFSSGLVDLGRSALKATTDLETAATQFEVLTGSAAGAADIIKDLQEFTARTPFRFDGVAKAAQRLLSFGFTADEVKERLQDLGDVSAASGADIGELSLIFGQVRAAGKLTGERLLQFQERAIPIGPALAKSLGVAESSIKDLVSQGAIDFATFEKAFQSLNDEGEFAFGGIDKRSRTLQGRISTLADNFELFAASIGEKFAPALKVAVSGLTNLIQNISNSEAFNTFITNIQSRIPSAIQFLANILNLAVNVFFEFQKGINTIGLVFDRIAQKALEFAADLVASVAAVQELVGIDSSGLRDTEQNLRNLSNVAKEVGDTVVEENNKISQSQQALTSAIDDGATNIIVAYGAERQAAVATANAVEESNNKKANSITKFATAQQLLAEAEKERQLAEQEEADIGAELRGQKEFDFLVTNLGEKEAARIAARAKELESEGKHQEAIKVLRDAQVKADAERLKLEDENNKRRVANQRSTLGKISGLQSSNNKTLAAIGKAAALTQIAIDGPQAVTKALAAFPPPFNFAAATAVGAAVAAQAARVAGVAFQDGGIVPGNSFSGDNVQARVNSGEMILNRQQQAQLFAQANGQGGSGGSQTIVVPVQIDGEEIARVVSKQVANGVELGDFE